MVISIVIIIVMILGMIMVITIVIHNQSLKVMLALPETSGPFGTPNNKGRSLCCGTLFIEAPNTVGQ